ncbi:hypothetical protein GGR28_001157 [Lewinella aquimaris]|uniref:DUF4386 family protein n=1 Tax=Neolewinella aquimaris TaxID=1835722 RepID=A0A840DZ45_9BACT|nr:hypothetical protein [Neolewinella aquimaris]MBB4078544.1 hypothetical protein [Neolewinella aquimaris]
MRYQWLLLFGLLLCSCVTAQNLDGAVNLNLARIDHQKGAMLVLGGWAVGNIGLGLTLRSGTSGETRRFHEMNAIWNVVNLGIAGLGYVAAAREDPSALDLFGSLQKNNGFEKILLLNAGLDVGYIMGGLYLRERAGRVGADVARLRGYGNSVLLQGGFLLLFDLVNYFIAQDRDDSFRLLMGSVGEGVGLQLVF